MSGSLGNLNTKMAAISYVIEYLIRRSACLLADYAPAWAQFSISPEKPPCDFEWQKWVNSESRSGSPSANFFLRVLQNESRNGLKVNAMRGHTTTM